MHQTKYNYFPLTHIPIGIWKTFEVTLHDPQMKELIWMRNYGILPRNEKIWKLVFYLFFLDAFSRLYWRPSQWSLDLTEHTHVSWAWTSAINQTVTLNQILQKIVLDAPLTQGILLPVFWYHLSRMQFWYFHYQLELQDQMSMT